VITLCAEENCPAWLGSGARVHWPLPDPAAATGPEEQVLDAFRAVRDELKRRLTILLDADSTDREATMTVELTIEGMSCEHCVARVQKALAAVYGVTAVEVTLEPGSATVRGEDLNVADLVEAVDRVGYTARAA